MSGLESGVSLTIATEDGRILPVDIPETSPIEHIHALIEAEWGIPMAQQALF